MAQGCRSSRRNGGALRSGLHHRAALRRTSGLVLEQSFHRLRARTGRALTFAGAFEREAIRPYITGKFEDMLLAVASHPAMLLYLNNAHSIGPDSAAGQRIGQGPQRKSRPRIDGALFAGRRWRLYPGRCHRAGQDSHRLEPRSRRGPTASASFANRHEPGASRLRGKTYPPTLEGRRRRRSAISRMIPRRRATSPRKFAHPFHRRQSAAAIAWRGWKRRSTDTGGDLHALWRSGGEGSRRLDAGPGEDAHAGGICDGRLSPARPAAGRQRRRQQIRRPHARAPRLMGEIAAGRAVAQGLAATLRRLVGPRRRARPHRMGQAGRATTLPAPSTPPRSPSRASVRCCARPPEPSWRAPKRQGDALALLISSPEFQRR